MKPLAMPSFLVSLLGIIIGTALYVDASKVAESTDPSPAKILALADHNHGMLVQSLPQTEWIVLFYADWCGACNLYKPTFRRFAAWAAQKQPALRLASVDYNENPQLLTRFRISHLPTVYHIREGEYREISEFRNDLEGYFEDRKFEQVQQMHRLLSPFSIVGWIFGTVGLIGSTVLKAVLRLSKFSLTQWCLFSVGILAIVFLSTSALVRLQSKAINNLKKTN